MSDNVLNHNSPSLETGAGSPLSPAPGAALSRSSVLSNKLTGVLSRSYADSEIRDTLSILDARGVVNDVSARQTLRLDAQQEMIECNGAIVQDFGLVAEQLKRIGTMMKNLSKTCEEMRQQIQSAQHESAPMLEEAEILTGQKSEIETKQRLLDAFKEHFVLSDEDLSLLTSSIEPVDDRFFRIMSHTKRIRKDCEVLLGTENHNLGTEVMEQTSRNLNAAFEKLYNWTQRELKTLDLEDPQIDGSIRRAFRVLAEKPTLFQNCLDFFAEAREHTLSDAFHAALTDAGSSNSASGRSANPIELQTHDLLRYVGDMLAWVHSTTVSEREALEGLFISDGDEIAKEIQAGRESEPWSRVQDEDEEGGDDLAVFDGRQALNDLVNRALEGVGRLLKPRVEIAVRSNEDPLLVYKALNLFKFYQEVYAKLVGTPSILGNSMSELQTSTLSHFERLLHDESAAAAAEPPPEDLSTPPFLLHTLDQFHSLITTSPDLPDPELSHLLSYALVPFLDQCSELASSLPEGPAEDFFQLNYLLPVSSTLTPLLPATHSFLSALDSKISSLRDSLIETQHAFLLHESGVDQLLAAAAAAAARQTGPHSRDPDRTTDAISASSAFTPETLATSAAQLDDFLPSALMDLLENLEPVRDKGLAKEIAGAAAERFCADFERVEEVVLRADEGRERRGRRGLGGEEGGDGSEEEEEEEEDVVLLRDVYPRTSAEIRVLLS